MRKLLVCLGLVALALAPSPVIAGPSTVTKPYVVLILDTSGSMADPVIANTASTCGGSTSKLDNARCAIYDIASSEGDIVFGLGRYRETMTGTTTAATFPSGCNLAGVSCPNACDITTGAGCNANGSGDERFELLTPLIDGQNAAAAEWVNFSGNTCTATGGDPEMWETAGSTPIAGTLKGVKDYWAGIATYTDPADASVTTIWPSGGAATGFAPIANDPTNQDFLPATGCNANPATCVDNSATGCNHPLCTAGSSLVAGCDDLTTPANSCVTKVCAADAHCCAATGTGWDATCVAEATTKCGETCSAGACSGANCCCATQCRPYVVILLTDGQETCSSFTNTLTAAHSLLTTKVGNDNYRVTTAAIGFGITPPTTTCPYPAANSYGNGQACEIEDIMHYGGTADSNTGAGKNEGFYATDQADVELAITSILAGAVRTEICNGLDDNCNGLVDEGFAVGLNTVACDNGELGVCKATGTTVCSADHTGVVCNAPTITPGTEICNGLDDDCDGKIDEGLSCTSTCSPEVCNNKDDDCDGQFIVDPDGTHNPDVVCSGSPLVCTPLTEPCGENVGVCTTGVQKCDKGVWGACSGMTGSTEVCDGLDNDCNGVTDGFSQACSNITGAFPVGDPRNNPGDPGQGTSCDTEGPSICSCHPGTETCPSGQTPPAMFGACLGEVKPAAVEVCDGLDNDCDGKVDEGTGGAPCHATCGVGVTVCVAGELQCSATGAGMAEICNGLDDDCDGKIDEGIPNGGSCNPPTPNNTYTVCNGTLECTGGSMMCEGGSAVAPEQCNCKDDDCDGSVDEGADICGGGGAICTDCQCAFPCGGGEFPCPSGKTCTGGYCVTDLCFGISCPAVNGNAQTCENGTCVDDCTVTTCMDPLICFGPSGTCEPNDCTTFPSMCTADQNCVAGTCVTNPCQGVTCNAPQYCESGTCVNSCAGVTCPTDQYCQLGQCVTNPCGSGCPASESCNTATQMCTTDPCVGNNCPAGEYCDSTDDGKCKTDPCVGTMCPEPNQVCKAGTCYAPPPTSGTLDGGLEVNVTTGGGGCDVGGTSSGGAGLLIALAGVLAARRRRVGGAA